MSFCTALGSISPDDKSVFLEKKTRVRPKPMAYEVCPV